MSNQEHLTPNPDFDWGMYEKGTTLSEAARKEQEAKYEETLNSLKVNEVVIGKVVEFVKNDKTIREVLVDVGYKSLGVVPYTEFRYNQDLKIGDEVEVYVISQEDRTGALVLSHRQARLERAWERINEAQEKDEVILGFIKSRTKGGMIVDVFGVEAFLPGSQIDVRPIRDYDALIDKTMEFKIVKINQEQKNVVVSHKILVEAELEQQKRDIISKLEKGQVLEGTVKNILPFGVFVDLAAVSFGIHNRGLRTLHHRLGVQGVGVALVAVGVQVLFHGQSVTRRKGYFLTRFDGGGSGRATAGQVAARSGLEAAVVDSVGNVSRCRQFVGSSRWVYFTVGYSQRSSGYGLSSKICYSFQLSNVYRISIFNTGFHTAHNIVTHVNG